MATKPKTSGGFTKVSSQELKDARLAGNHRKKPTKPKKQTVSSIHSYKEKYNGWAKEIKASAKEGTSLRKAKVALAGI